MAFLIAILTLALIGLVVLVVGAPLRRARRVADAGSASRDGHDVSDGGGSGASVAAHGRADDERRRDELEAAREAKYREIRDAELDFRTGKLSREDYEAIDAELRAEAIEILDQIEPSASEESQPSASEDSPGGPQLRPS
jgi:hypothetical protein